jgi:hypothetical protein
MRQESHRSTAIELEHERNVFEKKPAWAGALDEAEHLGDET